MAIIKSGASSDQLTIDSTSKAARVTGLYDSNGIYYGRKYTYKACANSITVAAGTGIFFAIYGSSTKTISIQRININGLTLTTPAYNSLLVTRCSTQCSGGTSVDITPIKFDTDSGAGTPNLLKYYTAAPTTGTSVGVISNKRLLLQSSTASSSTQLTDVIFDYRTINENSAVLLKGTNQGLVISFGSAPDSTVTLSIEVEWTEQ